MSLVSHVVVDAGSRVLLSSIQVTFTIPSPFIRFSDGRFPEATEVVTLNRILWDNKYNAAYKSGNAYGNPVNALYEQMPANTFVVLHDEPAGPGEFRVWGSTEVRDGPSIDYSFGGLTGPQYTNPGVGLPNSDYFASASHLFTDTESSDTATATVSISGSNEGFTWGWTGEPGSITECGHITVNNVDGAGGSYTFDSTSTDAVAGGGLKVGMFANSIGTVTSVTLDDFLNSGTFTSDGDCDGGSAAMDHVPLDFFWLQNSASIRRDLTANARHTEPVSSVPLVNCYRREGSCIIRCDDSTGVTTSDYIGDARVMEVISTTKLRISREATADEASPNILIKREPDGLAEFEDIQLINCVFTKGSNRVTCNPLVLEVMGLPVESNPLSSAWPMGIPAGKVELMVDSVAEFGIGIGAPPPLPGAPAWSHITGLQIDEQTVLGVIDARTFTLVAPSSIDLDLTYHGGVTEGLRLVRAFQPVAEQAATPFAGSAHFTVDVEIVVDLSVAITDGSIFEDDLLVRFDETLTDHEASGTGGLIDGEIHFFEVVDLFIQRPDATIDDPDVTVSNAIMPNIPFEMDSPLDQSDFTISVVSGTLEATVLAYEENVSMTLKITGGTISFTGTPIVVNLFAEIDEISTAHQFGISDVTDGAIGLTMTGRNFVVSVT